MNALDLKFRIRQNRLSNMWVMEQLSKDGIVVSSSTLSAVLCGARKGPAADKMLEKIKEILDDYEAKMAVQK